MIGRARSLLDRLLARHRAIATDAPTDADLLARFARDRDPAAFELLVWRHGGAVLGVCRRALRDEHAAEDAFQAVFLVLARKAGAVRGNLGGWLFKVARRVSARAAARRLTMCEPLDTPAPPEPDAAERAELFAVLDAEIARLPERLRAAVVLCYLGDHSTEAAARELGCPRGTVLSRLATAREKLAGRLARRGVALPAALTVPTLGAPAVSAVSAEVVAFCGGAAALSVPSQLALGVLTAMNRSTLLAALGAAGFVSVLGIGLGVGAAQPAVLPVANAPLAPPAATAPPPAKPAERKVSDDEVQKLAKQIETLRFEIEAQEKQIALLGKANAQPAQAAALAARYAELEKAINQLDLETVKLQVEAEVLKKLLAEKGDAAADPQAVQDELDRDPESIRLKLAVQKAKELFEKVGGDNPNLPLAREARDSLDRAEAALKGRVSDLRKAIIADVQQRATAASRARIEQVELDLRVKLRVSEHYKTERDALKKLLAANDDGAQNLDKMKAALAPQRELLAQLQAALMRSRLEANGVTLPPAATGDDELDHILRELAELRKDVQELKRK